MTDVDFLIVGNGLAGTLLAFEMLDHGLNFRIMASPEKSRASMVAAGMFNPLVFKRMTKSWIADELLPVMEKRYRRLEEKLNETFFFKKDILKPLSEQEMLLWKERSLDPAFAKYIRSVETESRFSMLKNAAGYGVVTQSGHIQIQVFLDASEKLFRNENKLIDATISFDKFNPDNPIFQFGKYKFENIVFCEGYHLTQNPFLNFIPLKPVKGELIQIYAPELKEEFILNKKVFVLPVGKHRFKVGSTYEWKDLTEHPTQSGKNSIINRLEELISVNYKIEDHWAGIRPAVIDRRPVLGFHPIYNSISVFNGLGTKGVMLAPYFAREMFRTLTEKDYSSKKEVQLERFL